MLIRPGRFRKLLAGLCTAFTASLVASPVGGETLTLEIAQRELAEVASSGDLLMVANSQGLVLFDSDSRNVHRFLESGSSWGRVTKLAPGPQQAPRFSRLDSQDGALSFSSHMGVFLYSEKGAASGQLRLFQPGDIAQISSREWAVSLTNLPHPGRPGTFVGRGQFGEEVPRVVVLDRDLEVTAAGLLVEDPQLSGSAAVGQTLRLAWSGQHLYAAELASYKIYQLDRDLETEATFLDPSLAFQEQEQVETSLPEDDTLSEAQEALGADASRPPSAGSKAKGQRLKARYTPVVRDISWDEDDRKLLILVDAGALAEQPAIDLLDPSSGQYERVLLRFPADAGPVTLTQIGASKHYIWLRGYPGRTPTYRLAKTDLGSAVGEPSPVPEIIRPEAPRADG